jgi:hypothetical protein
MPQRGVRAETAEQKQASMPSALAQAPQREFIISTACDSVVT